MTSNLFNTPIANLVNHKPLEVLKLLAQYNPEMFKEQVHSRSKEGESFFITFLKQCKNTQESIELLKLCENFGYDIRTSLGPIDNSLGHNQRWFKLEDSENKPDFLCALENHSEDDFVLYLTEKLGQEYVKQLENDGWAILPFAYYRKLYQTIQTLTDYGLDYDKKYKLVDSLVDLASRDANLLNLYWTIQKQLNKGNNLEQLNKDAFENDLKWTSQKVRSIDGTKQPFKVTEIIKYLEKRLPDYNKEQQEKMMLRLVASSDLSVLTQGLKLIGKNLKTYKPDYYPLWLGMSTIKNQKLLYHFVEQYPDMNTYHEKTDTWFVKEFLKCVSNLGVDLEAVKSLYRATNNKDMRDQKIIEIVNQKLTTDFILSTVPNKEHSWFLELCTQKEILYKIRKYLNIKPNDAVFIENPELNINKHYTPKNQINMMEAMQLNGKLENLTEQQYKLMREALERTWLNKDEKGRLAIDYVAEKHSGIIRDLDLWFLSTHYIGENKIAKLVSCSEKEALLSAFINGSMDFTKGLSPSLAQRLYDDMQPDTDICWNNVILNDAGEDYVKDKEIGFELKAIKMVERLQGKLPDKEKTAVKKAKI
jgi:hypothetical protein